MRIDSLPTLALGNPRFTLGGKRFSSISCNPALAGRGPHASSSPCCAPRAARHSDLAYANLAWQ